MLKRQLCLESVSRRLLLFSLSLFALVSPSALANPMPSEAAPASTEVPAPASPMIETSQQQNEQQQNDPLGSPHPIPWHWVLQTQEQVSSTQGAGTRYYRSPALISPDGQYAAYSRIQLQVKPEMYHSRVTSVMFVENLSTKHLRAVTAASPLGNNPLTATEETLKPGMISILTPVAWSQNGDRILARQFEGWFNTSDASDYAVVWDRKGDRSSTITPNPVQYEIAVLLGWSQSHPDQVLFRAGNLGEENWSMWAVDPQGETHLATNDHPMVFGKLVNNIWAGPQAYR